MASYGTGTRPAQFRFPEWAHLFVEERATSAGSTKTEVVLEALECLRQREVEQQMAEGYSAREAQARECAEAGLPIAAESWPEW